MQYEDRVRQGKLADLSEQLGLIEKKAAALCDKAAERI